MRGLYFNTKVDAMAPSIDFFAEHNHRLEAQVASQSLVMIYSKYDWPETPVVSLDNGGKLYCYGWFIYQDERNNLARLANDYVTSGAKVFDAVELGCFVMLYEHQGKVKVIVDRFSISTHYCRQRGGQLEIAPSVAAFDDLPEANPVLSQVLERKGHLFGNYTVYDGIERLDPSSELSDDGTLNHYGEFRFDSPDVDKLDEIPALFAKVAEYWPKAHRTLPISGGLDSRLCLVYADYEFGYTYGPESSGDRPIARLFSDSYNRYEEFEFKKPELLPQEQGILDKVFFGVSSYIPQLMSTYYYTFGLAKGAYALFDGYLGDVFQRGNYLKFPGPKGTLLKMFPWIYKFGFSAEYLIRQRHKAVGEAGLEMMLEDFRRRTAKLDASDYQKLTWWEFVYGRGGRYIVNGGCISSGQFYTPVPVFLYRPVFDRLIAQDFADAAQYKTVARLWKTAPQRYRQIPSDAGVGPTTPYWITPFKNLATRFLTHYVPGYGNYAMGRNKRQ